MEVEYYRQIFEKYSNSKFRENPSSGSRIVPCEGTDRRRDVHDEAISRFLEFCERTKQMGQQYAVAILSNNLSIVKRTRYKLFRVY